MSALSICLFGRFNVRRDEQVLTGFEAHKVQELCAHLLLHRDRPHPREELATLLWGDSPSVQAKKQLRQTLWQLQSALGQRAESADSRVLVVLPEWVSVNTKADVWLDVALFDHALAHARGIAGRDLDREAVGELRNAADLYRGDFLEGCYQDWCLFERERLQNAYLSVLDKLMDYCEAHDECESGLAYGEAILRYDRARERTHQRLMYLRFRAGDRAGALRQYERCAAALQEELGVRPGRRTVALCEQIRADQLDGWAAEGPPMRAPSEPITASLSEAAARLRQLRAILEQLELQLEQGIESVDLALRSRRHTPRP